MIRLFVLGGARSGKSRYAQARAEETGLAPVYIATAEAWDAEMRERIAHHQADRGPQWTTVEAPLALPQALREASTQGRVVLVDCLTLWLTNLMLGEHDIPRARDDLIAAIEDAQGPVILVGNETGLGIVPDNALARRFRDENGRLNQIVAACAHEVQFLAAGLPLALKSPLI